jgi:MFS transporter, PPP family, 3-phenylpropionic acid transporter
LTAHARPCASKPVLPATVRASLAYFVLFGGFGAYYPYISLSYLERGLGYADIGWLISVGALVGFIAGPAWGSISDRYAGSPRVLLASAAVAILGTVLLAVTTDFVPILAANIVLGLGFAGLTPIVDARAIETAGKERAGFGPLRAWGSAGYVVFAVLTGLAIERWGLGVLFAALLVGLITTALLGLGLAPAVVARAERPLRPLRATLRVFRTRSLLLFLVGMLFATAAMAAALNFFPLRLDELGAEAGLIGVVAATAAVVEVPLMLRFPSLARRFGSARLLVAGVAVLALRSGLAALASDPAVLIVASGMGGIGYALFTIAGVTYVAEHVPPQLAATGQGIFQGVTLNLSQVIAAATGGLLAGALGIDGMFGVAAAVGLAAAVVVALAVLPRSRHPAAPRSA